MTSLRERLLSGLIVDPSGCLLWTRALNAHGYGSIHVGRRRMRLVHLVMWEMFEGPVPDGMELDHVKARGCINRHCASIAHLEPVTHHENLMRGGSNSAMCAIKTHCDQGHPFDLLNTYYRTNGARSCRECKRDRDRRYRRLKATASQAIKIGTAPGRGGSGELT